MQLDELQRFVRSRRWRVLGAMVLCHALVGSLGCSGARERPGVATLLLPRAAEELDPRFAADSVSLKVSRLLFSSLITIDPQTLEPTPQLAQEVTALSDNTYGVELRRGLRFSDGSVLDSTDVAATFRGIVDKRLGSRYASTYRRIARIDVHDSLHLTFHLDGPHATFVTDLEMPIVRAEDALRHQGYEGVPVVSSGPYVIENRGRGELLMRARKDYVVQQPRLPRLLLRAVRDDNIRALRLLSGTGDLALDAMPDLLLPLFSRDDRFSVRRAVGVGTVYLGLNLSARALSDVRVRRALAHAIDRKHIIASKMGGLTRPARGLIPPGHWAYAQDTPTYAFDPKRSRLLLAEAGVTKPLHLTLRCSSDRSRVSMARVIAAMLRDVGVEVEVRPSELSTVLADLSSGRFELTLMELPELLEPHLLSWFFDSSRIPGPGVEGANRWRFRNAQLDAALERGRRQVQRSKRVAAYREVQHILADQLPVIPLWHRDMVLVTRAEFSYLPVPRNGRYDGLLR